MKKILIWLLVLLVLAAGAYYFLSEQDVEKSEIFVNPKKGDFRSSVKVSGELRAENSIDIRGPMQARTIGIWEMKISNLVEEGKFVKEGDFVAELDKAEIMNKIKDIRLSIQQIETRYTQAQLDSAIDLSGARDQLENLKFDLEEKALQLEQSAYEAPAVIKQVEIAYERSERALKQSEKNYKTRVKKSIGELSLISTDLQREQQKLDMHLQVLEEFSITAPAEGMVIYARDWGGRRKVVGSTVDAWRPVVATLPDLNSMESIAYVNEVDIQKVKEGQKVEIGLDANPDKKFTGEIKKVANIGEERSGTSSKVFEVIIKVIEKDTTLLPSMTTSNEIVINEISNVITLPIECIYSETIDDSVKVNYVFVKSPGIVERRDITVGEANDTEILILSGLTEEDNVLLTAPDKEILENSKTKISKNDEPK